MAVLENKNILACVNTINSKFPETFILVGGASMVKRQCNRTTNDVDVLVPQSTNINQLRQQLIDTTWFYSDGGVLFVKPSSSMDNPLLRPIKVDILTDIVQGKGFNDLIHHTTNVGGNLMLTLPMSLGVKLKCWYLRAEDENGMNKKRTDMEDILFLANLMRNQGIQIDSSAAELKICHYNLLLVRLELSDHQVELLRTLGCSKFLQKYEDNTADQRELYEAMGAKADTDPLGVELEYDEDEGEVEGH